MKSRLFLILCLVWTTVFGQFPCAFPDDGIRSKEDLEFAKLASQRMQKTLGVTRTIPTVVSVFSSSNGAGNISDQQVQNGIDVLNQAFKGQFGGIDTEIQFCLSGIKRYTNSQYAELTVAGNELAMKQLAQEDPFAYYNVYLVEKIIQPNGEPASGFSFTPKILSTDPEYDGSVVLHSSWGSIGTAGTTDQAYDLGRIAVHEAGHWLNLLHPFGTCDYQWNCEAENDCCCDTPPMTPRKNKQCRERNNTCHTDSPDERDPIHNYMGYTDDDCRYEFTNCQSGRMNACLDLLRPGNWFVEGECPTLKRGWGYSSLSQDWQASIFPNPFTDASRIRIVCQKELREFGMQLFDALGRRVALPQMAEPITAGQHEIVFGSNLVPGTYFLVIRDELGQKVVKCEKLR